MVQHWLFFPLIMLFSLSVFAQDERYYRQIFSGDLPKIRQEAPGTSIAQFNVSGAGYHIDLDNDKIEEIILVQKRDGVDWIEIRNLSQTKLFEGKLLAMGSESSVYKLKFVHISKTVKALLIFLDEGRTVGRRFESTARLFVGAFEKNDIRSMVLTEGPHFFHEREGQREQYWRRDYNVNIFDMDGDGVREIAVQYNHINRIMRYTARGEWERL